MKTLLLTNHVSGAVKLRALVRRQAPPAAVITLAAAVAARHQLAGFADVAREAAAAGLPVHYAERFDLTGETDRAFLDQGAFDLLLISGWQRLIPKAILNRFRHGAIAEHGSSEYLPRGRGRAPVVWTILEGKDRFVLHLIRANEAADAGQVLCHEVIPILPADDVFTLFTKIGLASARMTLALLKEFEHGVPAGAPQAEAEATYLRKRGPDDDWIDWQAGVRAVVDKVRALTVPYPCAKTRLGDRVITIRRAQDYGYAAFDFNAAGGEITAVFPDGSFTVKVPDGAVLVRDHDSDAPLREGDRLG